MLIEKIPISTRDGNSVEDILKEARERATFASDSWTENYDEAKDDLEFLSGEQWDSKEKASRKLEGRPALTLNQLPKFVDQILGDQRQNRPSINIAPTNSQASSKLNSMNGKQYALAEVYEGLIRNIEYACNAEASYDQAFQHAVESGFGWLRVYTDYSDNDSFDQDIKIKTIRDRFSVLIDPRTQEVDGSDMNWCFITESMSRDEFRKRYPNAQMGELTDDTNWWLSDDSVRVAEYFTREPVTREILLLSDGRTVYMDEIKDVIDELKASGITIQRSRKVKTYKVIWRKITAYDVLEGPKEWVGSTIPVVPVWGKDIILEGQPKYRGLIRNSKDAQKMHNYWMTTVTERVALAPKSPFIGPANAFKGYEQYWNNANRKNFAWLPYNDTASAAPQRQAPSTMPTAEIQMAMSAIDEIKNTIGMYDASLGQASNETSGRAILARQRESDTGTFAFIDNLTRAIRRVGKICIEIIPKIYDAERSIRIRFKDGKGDNIVINQTILDVQTGKEILVHDISVGKYDVVVNTGPSYNTQRMEAAESMMQFVQAMPQAGQIAADLIAQNMDWVGADEIAKRMKKILPPNMLSPEEMQELEMQPPQPPQPSPQEQMAMQMEQMKLEAQKIKSDVEMQKAQLDLQMKQLDMQMEQMKAGQQLQQSSANNKELSAQVRQLVAEALAEL